MVESILDSKFVKDLCDTTANMYRLGWDERNGGNISVLLDDEDVSKYLDLNEVKRNIPIAFEGTKLAGKYFIVTGSGVYFKNIKKDPENGLGIIRISQKGDSVDLSGGWENEDTPARFANYCEHVVEKLGSLLTYVCTINEANMGLQLASMIRDRMSKSQSDVQVGINFDKNPLEEKMNQLKETYKKIFGVSEPQHFLSQRTENGDLIIMQAHKQAKEKMKRINSDLKIGLTLSLHDFQAAEGGEQFVVKEWEQEFAHYIPFIEEDDFIGVQNYTRKIIGPNGVAQKANSGRVTQMGYAYYPEALEHVIRKVHQDLKIPIIVTENGISTADDQDRIDFIRTVMSGVESCIADGIPVLGYMQWSLLDNFEWQLGFSKTFGLIAVNRETKERLPKGSLGVLGSYRGKL